jgi:hypothetical protein
MLIHGEGRNCNGWLFVAGAPFNNTVNVCDCIAPPLADVKVTLAGLTVITGAPCTVNVTGTSSGEFAAPAAVITTAPLYVPGVKLAALA